MASKMDVRLLRPIGLIYWIKTSISTFYRYYRLNDTKLEHGFGSEGLNLKIVFKMAV